MSGQPPPANLGFVYVFEPPKTAADPILLTLHGTGGNEQDLLPAARMIGPSAGVLSPRGKVLERGMPRFFRRIAEGVFDLEDLKVRTDELAEFLKSAAAYYRFDVGQLVAVGFSNGANIGASLLLLRPDVLRAGALIRAMVPIVPEPMPALSRTRVLISNGERDALVSSSETERLTGLFRAAGADVTLALQSAGHELTEADISAARTWLSGDRVNG
jgi:phospholipase/carboxylesterase